MDLNIFWFIILAILLTGYAVLDGFDLGVGIMHLFVREDNDRRILMNSIGPLWDGNEVWLVTFGGALFAAFPHVYATAFSGFYLPFMLLLFALIFRAVSMEFRSKQEHRLWRQGWDVSFSVASTLATFLFGVAVGNMMIGLPVGADMEFQGTVLDLVGPFPLLIGVFAVATFAMHGSIYLYLKTEGDLQKHIHRWMWRTFGIFLVLYIFVTMATLILLPGAVSNFREIPWAWV
ncbi:MAG: cytochrome d ubiquinol oxidase subunit II, partial [Bacteroidetes bacterium]|nr:cytochrome d ubiquinol oxidase subunit II [Bacteroidota bacterium]